MEQTVDGAGLDPEALDGAVTRLLDLLDGIKREHLSIALSCLDRVRREYPFGLPHHEIRSPDEPLLGSG